MTRPKLLFISNLFPDSAEPYRGLDNATLLHHLDETFEIRVISPGPALPLSRPPERKCRDGDRLFAPVYPRTPYIPKIGSRFNHRHMAAALRPALLAVRAGFQFDAVLCSWIYPDACAVSRLARETGFPFVAVAQGSDVHQYLKNPVRRKIIADSMAPAYAIITRSADLGRLLSCAGVASEKIHTIYNGIDSSNFSPLAPGAPRKDSGIPADARVILFVGNFLPVKNPLLLIEAHAAFCRAHPSPECRLVLIGGGPMENDIRVAAAKGGFADRVHIAGRKNAAEIANAMRAADLLCLPSWNEGVPNVILEAFTSGLRVVASNVGGIPEVLNRDFLGKLVEPGNVRELVEAFSALFAGSAQTGAIRDHGLQFSWTRAASEYATILDQARLQTL